jgi:hypothetical protein
MALVLAQMTEAPKYALLTAARGKIELVKRERAIGLVGW